MAVYSEYYRNYPKFIYRLLVLSIGLLTASLHGCASIPQESENTSAEEEPDGIVRQVTLSELQGRVLVVHDTYYEVGQKNMPLATGDRVITVENARASLNYAIIDKAEETTEITCTVRLPIDSQFTVKDDIDCISGSIIANNVGVSESEIKQPFIADPPKRTRIAQNTKTKRSKKRKSKKQKRKQIAKATVKTSKASKKSKKKALTMLAAVDIHTTKPQPLGSESAAVNKELVQADEVVDEALPNNQSAGAIPAGSGVAIVQDIVSAGAVDIERESQPDENEIAAVDKKPLETAVLPQKKAIAKFEAAKKADTTKKKTNGKAILRSPATVSSGSSFGVKWQGPDQPYDYITVVSVSADQGAYSHYVYTKAGGRVVLNAPQQPGKYEIRYVDGNTQKTLTRRAITIH